jgi:hypothetical protein
VKYRAKLNKIEVPLQKLLLDPNNPRFLEDHDGRVNETDWADSGVQTETAVRMQQGHYRIEELKKSIRTNGWQPVDMIFVKKVDKLPGHYVVLEGNRRVTALRQVIPELPELANAVDPLTVLEVVGTEDIDETTAQISYLLGVRHHGSLKTWGPFAQAHDLYERYLTLSEMTDATFKWDDAIADKISAQLSLERSKIKERIRVYRVMKQLNEVPVIERVGMQGHYYSLVKEALPTTASNPLSAYLRQDPSTFRLDDIAIQRMDRLCHFSTQDRKGAPVSSPDEWRPLSQILKDPDPERTQKMLNEVEHDKRSPTEVLAARQAELRQPRWDLWLKDVAALMQRLQIANIDPDDPAAQKVVSELASLLDALPHVGQA